MPDAPQIQTALRNCPLFSEVTAPGLLRLTAMARLRRYEPGELIFGQSDPCPGVFIVGEGSVRIFKLSPAGKEHVLQIIDPGMTFAEVAAIGNMNCPANAQALEPTRCVVLPTRPFNQALETSHELCLEVLRSMTGRVRHMVDLLEDVVLRDAASRVARFLLDTASPETGEASLPALKRHVASHLNLTSETLSRTLRRLTRAGLIDPSDPRSIQILDPDRLRDLAEGA